MGLMGLLTTLTDLWDPSPRLLKAWQATLAQDQPKHPPLPSLLKPVHRLFRSPVSGALRSAFKGEGLTLKQIRPYEPGDNLRDMDWSVMARTGKAHVREYFMDTQLPTWFIVDMSAGMICNQRLPKVFYATAFVEWLALCAHQCGNAVGLMLWDGSPNWAIHAPTRPLEALSTHVRAMANQAEAQCQAFIDQSLPKILAKTQGFGDIRPLLRGHANLHFITDRRFFGGLPEARQPLSRLAHKHHCLFWILDDPADATLPPLQGTYLLADPDGEGAEDWITMSHRATRQAYAHRAGEQLETLAKQLHPFGELRVIDTTLPVADALVTSLQAGLTKGFCAPEGGVAG